VPSLAHLAVIPYADLSRAVLAEPDRSDWLPSPDRNHCPTTTKPSWLQPLENYGDGMPTPRPLAPPGPTLHPRAARNPRSHTRNHPAQGHLPTSVGTPPSGNRNPARRHRRPPLTTLSQNPLIGSRDVLRNFGHGHAPAWPERSHRLPLKLVTSQSSSSTASSSWSSVSSAGYGVSPPNMAASNIPMSSAAPPTARQACPSVSLVRPSA
jgi:hypothetical protein